MVTPHLCYPILSDINLRTLGMETRRELRTYLHVVFRDKNKGVLFFLIYLISLNYFCSFGTRLWTNYLQILGKA